MLLKELPVTFLCVKETLSSFLPRRTLLIDFKKREKNIDKKNKTI